MTVILIQCKHTHTPKAGKRSRTLGRYELETEHLDVVRGWPHWATRDGFGVHPKNVSDEDKRRRILESIPDGAPLHVDFGPCPDCGRTFSSISRDLLRQWCWLHDTRASHSLDLSAKV